MNIFSFRKAFDIIGKLASGYRNKSGYVVVMQQPEDSGKIFWAGDLIFIYILL